MKKLILILSLVVVIVIAVVMTNSETVLDENGFPTVERALNGEDAKWQPEPSGNVTWENYSVAETDWNYRLLLEDGLKVNEWLHQAPVTVEVQSVIRANRDVAYSNAVVDVTNGATFSVPMENNEHFQIIHIIDENHLFHKVIRRGESITITADDLTGGSHVYLLARTRDTGDLEDLHRRQGLLYFEANSSNPYVNKDFASDDVIEYREKLISIAMNGAPMEADKGFGVDWNDVDFHHLNMVSAYGWGGLSSDTIQYLDATALKGDVPVCSEWRLPNFDVDEARGGYWSVTMYGATGWVIADDFYRNNEQMRNNGDGTTSLFINCGHVEELAPYSLEVKEGWAGMARVYEPTDWKESLKALESARHIPLVPVAEVQGTVAVTLDNFANAETDHYFNIQLSEAGVNEWKHERVPVTMHNQTIIRSNIDLIYSTAVVDASESATITVPPSDVYQIAQLIDEDHYIVGVVYPGESLTVTPDMLTMGNHFYILKRTAIDGGLELAQKLQDATLIDAKTNNPYRGIQYDKASLDSVRSELEKQGPTTDYSKGFGTPEQVEEPHRTAAAATGWAGLAGEDAQYLLGKGLDSADKCGAITFQRPPLNFENNGYFSVIQYDKAGWLDVEKAGYAMSEMTVNEDGSYTVHYGKCAVDTINHLEANEGYYWGLRFYRPNNAQELASFVEEIRTRGMVEVIAN